MCGCGKRTTPSRNTTVRPNLNVRANIAATQLAPAQALALGAQTVASLTTARQMDGQRRRVEKLRRDAIRNSLGK